MDYEAEYNKLKTEFDSLKSESRKWEDRSKSNYDELQKAQEALTEKDKELEGAVAKAAELENSFGETKAALDKLESEKAHAELVADVAKTSGVDASVLRGSTKEELEAHAETLQALLKPAAPVIQGQANVPGEQPADELREFTRNLFKDNE